MAKEYKALINTPERMVEVALAEVGYVEGPKDNETKYGAFTKHNFQPWCGSFLMWCAKKSGVTIPNVVSVIDGMEAFRQMDRLRDKPRVGDLAFFNFSRGSIPQHVGLVVEVNSTSAITCIEGNTSSKNQANGGQVEKKPRPPVFVIAYGRPKYIKPATKEVATNANN
jgi:hypothetical protein